MLNGQMEGKELHQPAARAGNLTAADRVVVVDVVQKHWAQWAVVESKRSDAVTVKVKSRSWQQIAAAELNAVSESAQQQVKQVIVDSNRYNGMIECTKTHC